MDSVLSSLTYSHQSIKATREGLIGKLTASGYVIDRVVPFVALPAEDALHRRVLIRNCQNGKTSLAIVLDVGPHHTTDEAYVFQCARPRAESEPYTNGAGIDLSERVHQELGLVEDNGLVDWEFVL